MTSGNPINFNTTFYAHAKSPGADGKLISYTDAKNWLQEAKIVGNKIANAQAAELFNKYKAPAINFQQFDNFVNDLANTCNIQPDEMKKMLLGAPMPGNTSGKQGSAKKQ